MSKQSNIITHIAEVTPKRIKYMVYGDNRLRTHFTTQDGDFAYDKLVEGMHYVITCENIDGIWEWISAIPLDITTRFQ